ncbi:MAG: hypothetical protein AAGD38_07230 [Acidobacteriota bacterium]
MAIIDPYTSTAQKIEVQANSSNSSVENAVEALGGKRNLYALGPNVGYVTLAVGGGTVTYKLEGTGGQEGRVGWLSYAGETNIDPVDLTNSGEYNAFRVEVLEQTGSITVQIDAIDADGRSDSVAQLPNSKPELPLVYYFREFITEGNGDTVNFSQIVGVQIEFDMHDQETGQLQLGPLETARL